MYNWKPAVSKGFPINITSFADRELTNSSYYSGHGSPNSAAPLTTLSPKAQTDPATGGLVDFNSAIFANNEPLGIFGEPPCGSAVVPVSRTGASPFTRASTSRESKYFGLRGECHNAFNHANFGLPDGEITAPASGGITSAEDPRLVQWGLKCYF